MNKANLVFAIIANVELDFQSAPWIKRFARFGLAACRNPATPYSALLVPPYISLSISSIFSTPPSTPQAGPMEKDSYPSLATEADSKLLARSLQLGKSQARQDTEANKPEVGGSKISRKSIDLAVTSRSPHWIPQARTLKWAKKFRWAHVLLLSRLLRKLNKMHRLQL